MVNVGLWCLVSADGAAFDIREIVGDNTSKFVSLCGSLHVPVTIDAQDVESVEAVVYAHQVKTISEGLHLQIGLRLTEWFEAHRATPSQRVVVLRHAVSQLLVQVVEEAIDLGRVFILVAVSLQTLDNIAFEHIDLVIVKALRRREFKSWWTFRELSKRNEMSLDVN